MMEKPIGNIPSRTQLSRLLRNYIHQNISPGAINIHIARIHI
jgi:hypothetical protein